MSLKKYKKVKYLGKGSYGAAILVCLKSDPKENFVIKEIVIGHLKDSEQQSAKNEVEVLRQMHHSNIAMYVESFVENSKLYIVMEYANGGDLTRAVQRRKKSGRRWNEDEVMRIFVQICLALKHVHDQNILHRDLKSQNIFLTNRGIVKLGDFGIAKILDASGDEARTQIGTPYYLSPEICESKPYGRSSDMWSLGVVFYELLVLDLPFTAHSLPALVVKICSAEPSWNVIEDNYSPEILTLARQMIMKNPFKRPTVKDIVRTEFVTGHISRLLSHTIRKGTGGAESAVTSTCPTDSEERQLMEQLDKEKPHPVGQMHRERQAKREEEREKLRKFRCTSEHRHKEREESEVEGNNIKMDDKGDVRQRMKHHKEHHLTDDAQKIYIANQVRARESRLNAERDIPNKHSKRCHTNNPSGRDVAQRVNDFSQFEGAARREFFANRAAAQLIKARVEQYERVGGSYAEGGHIGGQQEVRRNMITRPDTSVTGEDRIAQVKAQRERAREQENSERQRQLQVAYEETRAAKARLTEQRKKQEERTKLQDDAIGDRLRYDDISGRSPRLGDDSDQGGSHYERQRRREKQREEETRQREEAFRVVAAENRAQRRAMRKEGRVEAVAFSIDLNEVNSVPADSASLFEKVPVPKISRASVDTNDRDISDKKDGTNINNVNSARAQRTVSDGCSALDGDGIAVNWCEDEPEVRKQHSKDSGGRKPRKGWGAPIDPFHFPAPDPTIEADDSYIWKGNYGAPQKVQESSTLIRAYGESLAREVAEDEEIVLNAIEAKHGREHEARTQAKKKFRVLRAQQQECIKSFKRVASPSTAQDVKGDILQVEAVENKLGSVGYMEPRVVSSSRPNLNEILSKVAAANEEVKKAVGVSRSKIVSTKDETDRESAQVTNSDKVGDSEILFYSDNDDDGSKDKADDLVKTLDTWFTRHENRKSVDECLSESKLSRERREAARNALREESSWLFNGYDDNCEDEAGVENSEDGEMADLQCMLADVLILNDDYKM